MMIFSVIIIILKSLEIINENLMLYNSQGKTKTPNEDHHYIQNSYEEL